jgi:DNA-directed RNA polymerase alpha subunit
MRMEGEGPKRMIVRKQGPGIVTAGDIQTVGDVEILNPDHVLCTLDEGAEIRMEFTVNTGKGYVKPSATARRCTDWPDAGRQPVLAGQARGLQGGKHP